MRGMAHHRILLNMAIDPVLSTDLLPRLITSRRQLLESIQGVGEPLRQLPLLCCRGHTEGAIVQECRSIRSVLLASIGVVHVVVTGVARERLGQNKELVPAES